VDGVEQFGGQAKITEGGHYPDNRRRPSEDGRGDAARGPRPGAGRLLTEIA
jgi:hypothetical protein